MFNATSHRFLVPHDDTFRIAHCATQPAEDDGKPKDWAEKLEKATRDLGDWQQRLYSRGSNAVLIVLQALDAAGKDGTIRHVFAHINPCGLHVESFKQPSAVEAAHDFLWRATPHLPERGHVAVFNRSYYEEVLVVRVHPKFLAAQRLSADPSETFWATRYRAIVEYERHLAQEGTVVLKFWLNVSKAEQRRRLLERIDDKSKHWKFRAADLDERALWDDYIRAYESCLNATSRPWAPWYAIPADDKPYAHSQIAKLINAAVEQLDLSLPKASPEARAELAQARARLMAE
jgi:PPK2 family polyphosphate:nucleotide phosphotransferase